MILATVLYPYAAAILPKSAYIAISACVHSNHMSAMARIPIGGWKVGYDEVAQTRGHANWAAWVKWIEAEKGRSICGIKGRTTNRPCPVAPMTNGRCRLHGGAALGGAASPHFRHGRYSKYLPSHLLDDFEEAFADPEYLSCKEQIASSKARELELIRRLGETEPAVWPAIRRATRQLRKAITDDDHEAMIRQLEALNAAVSQLVDTDALWKELRRQQDHTRKLKETESRLKDSLDQRLDKDRALALMMWLVRLLKEKLGHEPEVLKEVSQEIRARLRAPTPTVLEWPPNGRSTGLDYPPES